MSNNPIAYAIYGINAAGKHYLRDVKRIDPADTAGNWKLDDDGLDDRWAGNEPLGAATNPSASELTDERALFEAHYRELFAHGKLAGFNERLFDLSPAGNYHDLYIGAWWHGWKNRAAIARQAAPEASTDGIRGPLTGTQRNDIRAYASTLHGGQVGAFDDIIRKASVAGYVNGRVDFASTGAAPEAPASEQQAIPMCESCDDPAMIGPDGTAGPCEACIRFATDCIEEPAATTASASDQKCAAPGSEGLPLCFDCKGRGYCSWSAAAPSRDAAPLSRQQIAQGFKNYPQYAYGAFEDGVRFAEKHHGIGLAQAPHAGAALDEIRAAGWAVAVHNDYRLNGAAHTFWLFTKDGRAIKGEGKTDAEALDQVRAAMSAAKQGEQ